ncbi:peptide chain release factor N(5)-glutamine methyltransferase [Patescibacteria group bacterium]|nr:peptide chain release factor N(5)-glutamine methyltransferase [Patescibacteria group bacterium]
MFTQEEQIVLAHILGKSREFIIARPEIKLSAEQRRRFAEAQRKLSQGIPLAYILGYKWFYGRKFAVNKNVLIPRPETELLVELAAGAAKKLKPQIIADIGTGSGAIIISLKKKLTGVKIKFLATDISGKALATAKANAKKLAVKNIAFKKGNLANPVLKHLAGKKIIVAANLPYLSSQQMKEPSIKFEPKIALYGGKKSTQKIAALLAQLSRAQFASAEIFLEADPSQMREIKKAAEKYFRSPSVKIHRDLAGRNRVVQISI